MGRHNAAGTVKFPAHGSPPHPVNYRVAAGTGVADRKLGQNGLVTEGSSFDGG